MEDPNLLALAYTRTMMAFELFLPAPRTIAVLGLGGGSIAKWCHGHYPNASLTVVEINPHVIAVRDAFGIPPNSQRFRILCEDGARFVAEQRHLFDVLLVDCFTTDRLPEALCSQAFYDHCRASLTENGMMVANLCWQKHTRIVSRIRKSFEGRVLLSSDADGNTVVFACKGEQLWTSGEDETSLRPKLKKFARKHRLGKAVAPRC